MCPGSDVDGYAETPPTALAINADDVPWGADALDGGAEVALPGAQEERTVGHRSTGRNRPLL